MEKSLMVAIEEAKLKVFSAFNKIAEETKLPPFVFESIATDLLCEIRKQKFYDLMAETENGKEEK